MSDTLPDFGDSMPPPPSDTRTRDSSHWRGRVFYGLRKKWLRLLHHPEQPGTLIPPDLVSSLLVIQLERLGDLILAEPALRALRRHYPNAKRTLIAPPFARELFAGAGWGEVAPPDAIIGIRKKYGGFDLAVDLTGRVELKIARLLAKSDIPFRVGMDRGGRGVYFTHPVPPPAVTVPTREVYLALTNAIGATAEDSIPRLPCGEDRLERGRKHWEKQNLEDPVVIMPGAHFPAQRWSLQAFATVSRVLQRKGIDIAVIVGPGEEDMGKRLIELEPAALIAAPSMTTFMDLLAASSVVACNNTGPLHLAASLGVPTVSIMGPTVPWRWWPASDAPAIVFRGGSDGPYGHMHEIDPMEVAAAALHLYEQQMELPRE